MFAGLTAEHDIVNATFLRHSALRDVAPHHIGSDHLARKVLQRMALPRTFVARG